MLAGGLLPTAVPAAGTDPRMLRAQVLQLAGAAGGKGPPPARRRQPHTAHDAAGAAGQRRCVAAPAAARRLQAPVAGAGEEAPSSPPSIPFLCLRCMCLFLGSTATASRRLQAFVAGAGECIQKQDLSYCRPVFHLSLHSVTPPSLRPQPAPAACKQLQPAEVDLCTMSNTRFSSSELQRFSSSR